MIAVLLAHNLQIGPSVSRVDGGERHAARLDGQLLREVRRLLGLALAG